MGYGFGGGFGGGNMQQLMRQAQKMQQDMARARAELDAREFTSSVGGGAVEMTMFGNRTLKSLKIKKEVVDPDDIEMLEDLVASDINDVLAKIDIAEKENMPNIPGM